MRLPLSCDARLDEVVETQPLDPFHDQVGFAPVRDTVLVGADDVLVAEDMQISPSDGFFNPLKRPSKLSVLTLSRTLKQTFRPSSLS